MTVEPTDDIMLDNVKGVGREPDQPPYVGAE